MGINEKAWGVGFKRLIGDESNRTYGICLDNTSKALHICDIEDAATDWDVSADSYPSVYIHDIAAPSTDYVKIYHDGTSGIIDCDGTTIFAMTASTLAISADVTVTGDVGLTGAYTFTGTVNHGAEAAGERVNFYGNTAGARMVWVDAGNQLYFIGATSIMGIGTGALNWAGAASLGSLNVLAGCSVQGGLSTASSLTVIGAGSFQASVGVVGSLTCNSHVIIGGNIEQTGNLHTVGVSALDSAVTLGSTLTMGASGAPAGDFILWPTLALAKVWLDVDGDTNGAWYFGADTKGIQVNLYGDVTGCGVFWDPTTDTNGTLTIGGSGGSAGNDVVMYGATNGASMTWDQSADYLVFAGAGRLEVGTFATPISLDTFSGNEDIHGAMVSSVIDAAMTAGEVSRNIWSRMKITADQTANVSIYGACLQCRVHTGDQTVDLTAGAYSGAWLYFEASDTGNVFTLDGATVAGAMATVEAAAGQALTTGSVYGIKINSAVNDSIDVSGLTSFSAIYINGGTGKEDWTTGIEITDSAMGITIVQDTLANDGRSMKIDTTSATPEMSDGYGAFEINGNVSGAAVGWFSPLSSWINITGSGAAGAGDYMVAQQNGVYADSGGNTSATIIFGMRAQAQLTDAPGRLCPFSLNTANRSIDALFDIAAGPSAGLVNGSPGSTADGTIPIVIDAGGTIRYIHVFSDRN